MPGTSDVMLVQDAFRIGYEAVKSLADKLSGRIPPRRLEIPARVVVRQDLDKPDVKELLKLVRAAAIQRIGPETQPLRRSSDSDIVTP